MIDSALSIQEVRDFHADEAKHARNNGCISVAIMHESLRRRLDAVLTALATPAPAQPEDASTDKYCAECRKTKGADPAKGAQEDEPVAHLRGLVEAVRLFRNEKALERLGALRQTPGYAAMCDEWEDARDFLEDRAAATVEGSVSAWTNIDEALPPEGVTVLGYADDVYLVDLETLNGPDGSFESWTHYGQTFVRPTRWAFLPAGPKEKP